MKSQVIVRKPFRFLPSVLYALAIDAIDLMAVPITALVSNIPVVGQLVNYSFTLFQGVLAGIIFEDPKMVLGMVEGLADFFKGVPVIGSIVSVGDAFIPSYTIMYFLLSWGKV